jgi:ribonuclease HI
MENYTIYTDGAYSSARNCGGVGLIILNSAGSLVVCTSFTFKNTTNNRMELSAVILGLKCIKKPVNKITIYTDSMYVIGCATLNWKRKKNTDLWEKFDAQMKRIKDLVSEIEFKHVKGHNGDKYNELCDKLAVNATL